MQPEACRIGGLDHKRRGESGEHRDGDDDGVYEAAHNAERHAETGEDEAEFTELREAESGVDRCVEALAGEQRANGYEGHNASYRQQGDNQDSAPVLTDDGGVYHHTDGHEEYRSEEVLDTGDEMFNMLSFNGLGEDRTHHESAEGGGETHRRGERDHTEAEAYGYD